MFDLLYIALTLALFALASLLAKGVEQMRPRALSVDPRDRTTEEEHT